MPRRLALSLLLLVPACLGPTAQGDEGIAASPRPLSAERPELRRVGEAEFLGALALKSREREFGGLSGMTLADGTLTAITDRGHWVSFRLTTAEDGSPQGVAGLRVGALGGLDGSARDGDAEEVVRTPAGLVVSFERRHRLLLYPEGLFGRPVRLDAPAGMKRLPDNGGVEAVAALPDGRLLLIAEEGGDGVSPAWIGTPGHWRQLGYPRLGLFHPTAAAVLPGGDLLVLERRFTFAGFSARLVRFPGAVLDREVIDGGRELLRLEPPLIVDNFEGMAVAPLGDGTLAVYLISDDNFSIFQQTLLMAFRIAG